jgi:2-C-methyl-D-erythritol 4-phosphate cytidylyltransferase
MTVDAANRVGMRSGLVLAAAGTGRRFGGAVGKQWLDLCGRPVWHHALLPFRDLVDDIVIVAHPEWVDTCRATLPFPGPRVIPGGVERAHSVVLGLESLHDCDAVLIHDAARPLIDPVTIRACLAALRQAPGCVVGTPCVDTLKRIDGEHILATADRAGHALAQTPQGLRLDPGLTLYRQAIQRGHYPGDDVQVLEEAGLAVRLVPGSRRNFKITQAEDLALAAALLQTD